VAAASALDGVSNVTFVDENFMGPGRAGRTHAAGVARGLRTLSSPVPFNFGCRPNDLDRDTIVALRDAGLAAVTLGVESMSDRTLALFRKGTTRAVNRAALDLLEELEIAVEMTFIFFHPLTTIAEIRQNLEFIADVRMSAGVYFNNQQPFTEFIPFFATPLTRDLIAARLVTRDLDGYTITYADPRVACIANLVRAVPTDDLARLRYALPASGTIRLTEIQEALAGYHRHLTMTRLPELAADLCDHFDRGGATDGARVHAVRAELDAESDRIGELIGRFASHVQR
jgi:hypothetical protein